MLVLLAACFVQDLAVRPASPDRTNIAAKSPDPNAPALIETEPKRVAYIEHLGPYWSLGAVIDRVARDAKAMGVRNDLVIRYLDDPVAASARGLRAHIGFELPGTEMPQAPYQVSQWPPTLTFRKTVNGPDGLSTRHFASLKAWAKKHELVPAGDLIALIRLSEDGNSTSVEHAEIFLPVCVPDPPQARVQKKATDQPARMEDFETADFSSGKRTVTKVIPLHARSDVATEAAGNEDSVQAALGTPLQSAPDVRLAAPLEEGQGSDPEPPVRPAVPVRQWIEEGKYAEVVGAMLPENADAASQQWADQVAARVIAVAFGVQKLSPGQEDWLAPLATMLSERRAALRSSSVKTAPRVIGLSPPATSNGAARKAVVRELDYLMANMSHRALSADEIREMVIQLMEKTQALVLP